MTLFASEALDLSKNWRQFDNLRLLERGNSIEIDPIFHGNKTSMADAITSLSAQRPSLQGLPLRLIQDGLLDEATMVQALASAKESGTNLVSHLVSAGLADAREIAIAASQEFGVPLLDLDAVQPDLDIVKLVSDKLLAKHRVLPPSQTRQTPLRSCFGSDESPRPR